MLNILCAYPSLGQEKRRKKEVYFPNGYKMRYNWLLRMHFRERSRSRLVDDVFSEALKSTPVQAAATKSFYNHSEVNC